MYIDLLSVLKGIDTMLGKALVVENSPEQIKTYVDCAKSQLDEVISGIEKTPKLPEGGALTNEDINPEEGLSPEAQAAKEDLI